MDIYPAYKPLRNRLKKLSLEDTFYVIWAYSQKLHFNSKIPANIQLDKSFVEAKHWNEHGVYPWVLEIILKETVLNGDYAAYHLNFHKTFKNWDYFAGANNDVRGIEEYIAKNFINRQNVISEINRVGHRQFHWQDLPKTSFYMRYYKIFSDEKVNEVVLSTTGLSVKEIYFMGLAFVGAYLSSPAILLPIKVEIENINEEKIKIFLDRFSKDVDNLKKLLISEQKLNEDFLSICPALRAYPMIKMIYRGQEAVLCPIPTLLFWRMTTGLYYEIYNSPNFDLSFGRSFEKYVGDVIKETIDKKIERSGEVTYKIGKEQKHSSDWLIWDTKGALFVECKTKRMRLDSKSTMDEEIVAKDLEKLSEFIFQTYKAIEAYKNNEYSFFQFSKERKIYPLILTLENWNIFGDDRFKRLDSLVKGKLIKNNINPNCLEKSPYTITSIDQFEEACQIISMVGIKDFMEDKVKKERRYFQLFPYYSTKFTTEITKIRSLWKEEHDKLFLIENKNE